MWVGMEQIFVQALEAETRSKRSSQVVSQLGQSQTAILLQLFKLQYDYF